MNARLKMTTTVRRVHLVVAAAALLTMSCQPASPEADAEPEVKYNTLLNDEYSSELTSSKSLLLTMASDDELTKMAAYLSTNDDPQYVVHDVHLEQDTFHCVQEEQQPSLRLLRAQGIDPGEKTTAPKTILAGIVNTPSPAAQPSAAAKEKVVPPGAAKQAKQEPDEQCEMGTVPVRHVPLVEVAAYGTLEKYLTKPPPAGQLYDHRIAQFDNTNYGGSATINIWSPSVPTTGDHSLSQIWAFRGLGSGLSTVEAGWIKRAGTITKLFVFATPNNYGGGTCTPAGSCCWNTDCGFIQNSGTGVYLDGSPGPSSVSGGTQYESTWALFKDGDAGDWWFQYNGIWVGKWPRSFFPSTGPINYALHVQYGGEVADQTVTSSHTDADMGGDGSFALSGYQHAAYQRFLRYYTISGGYSYLNEANSVYDQTDGSASCYSYFRNIDSVSQNYIYFGGPGLSSSCP